MALLDWFRGKPSPVARSEEQIRALAGVADSYRSLQSLNSVPSNSQMGGGMDAGVAVNERTALQHMAVYACARLLSDSVAALPQDVVRKTSNGARVPLDPSPSNISDPNPETTMFEHTQQVMMSLVLRGNSYEYVTEFDRYQWPKSRVVVHPDDVQVHRNRDTGKLEYKIRNELVPTYKVIHTRRLTLPGSLVGLSPIEQARQGIGLSLAAERYGARFFKDSANPSAVLESEANIVDAERVKIMQNWVATQGGKRAPALLTGGLHYRPIAITPNESQFLETRSFQRGEIAMMFGVPPHMIGDTDKSTSWGSGIEQQSIGFVQYTLLPWLRVIEATYTKYLLPRGQYMKFNVAGLLRGDTAQRYAAYSQARTAGWLSVNEIRALEDLDAIEGGDDYLQPLNMGVVGETPPPQPANGGATQ